MGGLEFRRSIYLCLRLIPDSCTGKKMVSEGYSLSLANVLPCKAGVMTFRTYHVDDSGTSNEGRNKIGGWPRAWLILIE
jgi:hypothetical protein